MKNNFEFKFSFSQSQVDDFAHSTGDTNPIHLDDEAAKNSIFGRKIIHGYLGASVFSRVFGTINPGFGTIYLSQSLKFFKPMYIETEYLAKFTVIEVFVEKHRAKILTEVLDSDGNILISGEALIQHESIK